MARFYNESESNAAKVKRDVQNAFADLLFHEMQHNVFKEKAPEVLANHLGVMPQDVEEWLAGKALPCDKILTRLLVMLRGDSWFKVLAGSRGRDSEREIENSSWAKIIEFVQQAENIQTLMNTKLTQPKAGSSS